MSDRSIPVPPISRRSIGIADRICEDYIVGAPPALREAIARALDREFDNGYSSAERQQKLKRRKKK